MRTRFRVVLQGGTLIWLKRPKSGIHLLEFNFDSGFDRRIWRVSTSNLYAWGCTEMDRFKYWSDFPERFQTKHLKVQLIC